MGPKSPRPKSSRKSPRKNRGAGACRGSGASCATASPRDPRSPDSRSPESRSPDRRPPAQRVNTAQGRKASSTRWLQRQLNDPYVAEAQRLGYRSRAAFKLLELDDKLKLLGPGRRVVDLGAAPGGWTQVACNRCPGGRIVAVDLLAIDPIPGALLLQADFLEESVPDRVRLALGGADGAGPERLADLVLSDMSPATTGHGPTDHLRIVGLVEAAWAFVAETLRPGGAFVAKVFHGGTEQTLLAEMKRAFETVRHVKPPASRSGSAETYVVARGFRPSALPPAAGF